VTRQFCASCVLDHLALAGGSIFIDVDGIVTANVDDVRYPFMGGIDTPDRLMALLAAFENEIRALLAVPPTVH
jgi:hypothetical protein